MSQPHHDPEQDGETTDSARLGGDESASRTWRRVEQLLPEAVRKALLPSYPGLADVHLSDYKVRILDGQSATAARTRVIIDSIDGDREWSTMGSDTNIISASAAALADSFEFAIWKQAESVASSDG